MGSRSVEPNIKIGDDWRSLVQLSISKKELQKGVRGCCATHEPAALVRMFAPNIRTFSSVWTRSTAFPSDTNFRPT